ncbi:hypothetical protein F5883DRAFT_475846, partial [Diaporthe sp. PMI_573]
LIISTVYSRNRKPNTEDTLFAITINSPSTLLYFILFYLRPLDLRAILPKIKELIILGNDLDGHPGICYSRIVATIFNKVLGYSAPASRLTG